MTPGGFVLAAGTVDVPGLSSVAGDQVFAQGDILQVRSLDGEIGFTVRIVEDGIRVEAIDPKAPAWNDDAINVDTVAVTPNIEFTYP